MKIKYLVLSDIHLGHNINKTDNIVNNLREYFITYNKEFKDLNMIILAGDVFDRLLINSSNDFILATKWLIELIKYCQDRNIILRILEGTPSHDWKQIKTISTIIEKLNINIDYKYIETLYIEQNDKLNINILYIPDEYKHNAEDTYKDVVKLLKKNKLTQVDITIMHGQFNYQMPVKLESSHNEDNYLSITKHYINIGHIHTMSVCDRILAQGSFDRLIHGEEEDKGGMLVTIDTELGNSYKFLPNKNAMIFKTIKFSNETLEEIIKFLDKELKKYKSNSNIRIIIENDNFLNKNIEEIRKRYSNLNIKFDKKKDNKNKFSLIEKDLIINSFNITKDNIEELLKEEMSKHNLTKEELEIFNLELKKVM